MTVITLPEKLRPQAALPLTGWTDPALSASLYCSGRLSEVILHVIAPFWRASQLEGIGHERMLGTTEASAEPALPFLWMMRYAKGGEHLKVRLHGPETACARWRDLLNQHAANFLDSLGSPNPEVKQHSRELATPIDQDDQADALHPDRTLRWTTYQRSQVTFGYAPYLDDETYLERLAQSLAAGSEIIFAHLDLDADGQFPYGLTLRVLCEALLDGLEAFHLRSQDRPEYLLYHRDWLLRASLRQSAYADGPGKMQQTLERFETRLNQLAPALEPVRMLAQGSEHRTMEYEHLPAAPSARWRAALRALYSYVEPLANNSSFHLDPFAVHPTFLPAFKAFHGLANQLGMTLLNEAFVHHILLQWTGEEALRRRPVQLLPQTLTQS